MHLLRSYTINMFTKLLFEYKGDCCPSFYFVSSSKNLLTREKTTVNKTYNTIGLCTRSRLLLGHKYATHGVISNDFWYGRAD